MWASSIAAQWYDQSILTRFLALLLLAVTASAAPPNIVLIFADDLGWTDLGSYGSSYYETPNIDRLRSQGLKFTDAYASAAQCSPTRACLLTGRDFGRHGIWAVDRIRGKEEFRKMVPPPNNTELPLSERTIADALRKAGYVTGMFGKWHLGNDGPYYPGKRGFDTTLVDIIRPGRYFGFQTIPPSKVDPQVYLTDFLTDRALKFLDEQAEKPFFLYFPHFAVHAPIQAKADKIAKFDKKKPSKRHSNATYAAMIESLDESVGRVLAKLDERNLADNTIVLFYSDNGGAGGYEREGVQWISGNGKPFQPTDNHPLRGGKGMLYEGGIRVPLIVRWPGVIEAGSETAEPVISTDFFPTFLEIADQSAPDQQLDGVSLVSLLRSSGTQRLEPRTLHWHYPSYLQGDAEKGTWRITPSGAIRSGRYKLIESFEDGRLQLYNLADDLSEQTDLASAMPGKANQLRAQLADWRERTNATMPTPK